MTFNTIIEVLASILSGFIAGYFTYLGVKITINHDKKKTDFDNKIKALPLLQLELEEYDYRNRYIQLSFFFTDESKQRKRKDIPDTATVSFSIKNIGMRELYNLYITDIQSPYFKAESDCFSICPIVYLQDKVSLNFSIYEMGSYDNDAKKEKYDLLSDSITFNCYFQDCYNNWYFQKVGISLFHTLIQDTPIEQKALNISISGFDILSSPQEVLEKDLPWKQENARVCLC